MGDPPEFDAAVCRGDAAEIRRWIDRGVVVEAGHITLFLADATSARRL